MSPICVYPSSFPRSASIKGRDIPEDENSVREDDPAILKYRGEKLNSPESAAKRRFQWWNDLAGIIFIRRSRARHHLSTVLEREDYSSRADLAACKDAAARFRGCCDVVVRGEKMKIVINSRRILTRRRLYPAGELSRGWRCIRETPLSRWIEWKFDGGRAERWISSFACILPSLRLSFESIYIYIYSRHLPRSYIPFSSASRCYFRSFGLSFVRSALRSEEDPLLCGIKRARPREIGRRMRYDGVEKSSL